VRSYLTVTKDLARVMSRVKAIYRSWAIPCTGKQVYAPRHRAEWLWKINELGVRQRAEFYYQQLDALRTVRREVRRDLLTESKKHKAWKLLCQIPSIEQIRQNGESSAQFARRCCWAFCRPRIVFAPNDSCGITAV